MIRFGTCSWNYDCWCGLIYDHRCITAAEYLNQYSKLYTTAEIDSWFYRFPSRKDVLAYKDNVPSEFKFTCKVPQEITLTHFRQKSKTDPLIANPNFLSVEKFNYFLDTIEPLSNQIAVMMFEFEYLNKFKMSSGNEFIDRFGIFLNGIPKEFNYGIEPRNSNYLNKSYFDFITTEGLVHVLSEKQFLPHVYEVYSQFKECFSTPIVIRLLGGDRKAIEKKTNEQWNSIVEEKEDIEMISKMILLTSLLNDQVYCNNTGVCY